MQSVHRTSVISISLQESVNHIIATSRCGKCCFKEIAKRYRLKNVLKNFTLYRKSYTEFINKNFRKSGLRTLHPNNFQKYSFDKISEKLLHLTVSIIINQLNSKKSIVGDRG